MEYRTSSRRAKDRFEWEQAIRSSDLSSTARLTGMMLATFGDASGANIWPSVETIAEATGKSVRTTFTALSELADKGWLLRIVRSGRASIYMLLIPADLDRPRGSREEVEEVVVITEVQTAEIRQVDEPRSVEGVRSVVSLAPLRSQRRTHATSAPNLSSPLHTYQVSTREEEARACDSDTIDAAEVLVCQAISTLTDDPRQVRGRGVSDAVQVVARLLERGVDDREVYRRLVVDPQRNVECWGAWMIARLRPLGAVGRNPGTLDTRAG